MQILRYLLMALSLLGGGFLYYVLLARGVHPVILAHCYAMGLMLNFLYLLIDGQWRWPNAFRKPRLLRLVGLWLDSKEIEFQKKLEDKK